MIESAIFCSHCPYYAGDSRILHCHANYGFIKKIKFDPFPENTFKSLLVVISFIVFGALPLVIQAYSLLSYIYENPLLPDIDLTVSSSLFACSNAAVRVFFILLLRSLCTRCANLSCTFNSVSKKIKERYLEKNTKISGKYLRHLQVCQKDIKY